MGADYSSRGDSLQWEEVAEIANGADDRLQARVAAERVLFKRERECEAGRHAFIAGERLQLVQADLQQAAGLPLLPSELMVRQVEGDHQRQLLAMVSGTGGRRLVYIRIRMDAQPLRRGLSQRSNKLCIECSTGKSVNLMVRTFRL